MTPNRTWAALRRLSQALFLAAVATGASVQISRAEGDLQKVSVRLDWLPGSNHAALFLARERGYYKDAGLDVEILPGQGSVSTLQLIGSGNHTIGLASLSAMALANSKGAPIIAIAGIMQRGPEAVVALASSNITKPSDLEGKKFGAVPSDQAQRLFDVFADVNKLDMSKIQKISLNYSNALTAVINGDVDFIAAWVVPDALKVAKFKPIAKPMVFSDYGINTLGTGIVVNKTVAKEKPDVLKRFLAATIRGAQDVEKDPLAGVAAVAKSSPEADVAILTEEVKALPHFLHTDNSAGKVYGWIAKEDLVKTIQIQEKYFGMRAGVTPEDIYTAEFFPPGN
jgi:NitT/TauT family transport system substrate-binding protein